MSSAPLSQSAIVRRTETGLSFSGVPTDTAEQRGAAIVAAGVASGVASTDIVLCGTATASLPSIPSATPMYVGWGGNRTVLTIDDTKANCAAFAARCYRMTIACSDGNIVRDFEPNDDGELVANIIPTAATREEIDEMLGPENLLVIGTDDDSINRLDGVIPGGKRLCGGAGHIEHIVAASKESRVYNFDTDAEAGDFLVGLLTSVAVDKDKIFVYRDCKLNNANTSPLLITPVSGVTLYNFATIYTPSTGTNGVGFVIPTGVSFTEFNFGYHKHRPGSGDVPLFDVTGGALVLNGPISTTPFSFHTTGIYTDGVGSYGVRVSGGSCVLQGGYHSIAPRISGGALIVSPFTGLVGSVVQTSGTLLTDKFLGSLPGAGFLSLIDDATAADIRNTAGASGGIFQSAAGGTGNGFTKFTGPASSEKTFTLPDSNATLLHGTPNGIVKGDGTGATSAAVAGTDYLSLGASEISALTEKTTLATNDLVLIEDSADSNAKKKAKVSSVRDNHPELQLPPYIAGRYYPQTIGIVSVGTGANTNQRMFLVPFVARQNCTIDAISINIPTTAGAGGEVVRLGLYGSSGGQPDLSNLVRDAGSVSISTNGVKTQTFSDLAVTKGQIYYLAAVANGTTVNMQIVSTYLFLDANGSSSPGNPVWNYHVAGVDPSASLPTSGSVVTSGFVSNCPVIWLRIKSVP